MTDKPTNIEISILFATHNTAKIERYKMLFEEISKKTNFKVKLYSPKELGLPNIDVVEDGKNEQENAYIKAKAYWNCLPADKKIPSLALDTGCYFEGVEDFEQPGVTVRRIVNQNLNDQAEATDAEIINHYQTLCKKYGGQIKGYFFDAHCIYFGEADQYDHNNIDRNSNIGEFYYKYSPEYPFATKDNFTEVALEITNRRAILLTENVVGEIKSGFPLMSMYKSVLTGKYHTEMTERDYLDELTPVTNALNELLHSFPDENTLILGKYELNMELRRRSLAVLKLKNYSTNVLTNDKYLGFIKLGDVKTNHPDMLTWVGGGVDLGETPAEAILREITEELGYTQLKIKEELGSKIIHYFAGKTYRVASVTYGFEVEILDISARQKAEIDDGIYQTKIVSKDEFLSDCQIEIAKEFLRRV